MPAAADPWPRRSCWPAGCRWVSRFSACQHVDGFEEHHPRPNLHGHQACDFLRDPRFRYLIEGAVAEIVQDQSLMAGVGFLVMAGGGHVLGRYAQLRGEQTDIGG